MHTPHADRAESSTSGRFPRRWGHAPPHSERAPDRVAASAPYRSTLEGIGAVPYLLVAVARPLLSGLWPLRGWISPPLLPGTLAPAAPERQLPPQPDWRAREAAITLRSADLPPTEPLGDAVGNPFGLRPLADSHAAWLAQKPYRLVLGSGFVGIYQHMGRVRALDRLGLVPHEIVGYSSGAIAGAMVCCLSLDAAERAMVELRVSDFLDPSFAAAWWRGGACAGGRLQKKIERTLAPGGTDRIEALHPPFQVAAYDREEGTTRLFDRGPLALRVRQSAGLPLLFAMERYIDGGWIDHHGRLAMLPGQRALQSRLRTGGGGSLAAAIGREGAIFSLSEDPEHATLSVQPEDAVREINFIYIIDHDKAALRRIVAESERLTLAWLLAPRPRQARVGHQAERAGAT